jgi:hypothetical protein
MNDWIKVAKSFYRQIEMLPNTMIVRHGFNIDDEHVGWMEVVDQEEDNIWFDYHVRKDFYQKWVEDVPLLLDRSCESLHNEYMS